MYRHATPRRLLVLCVCLIPLGLAIAGGAAQPDKQDKPAKDKMIGGKAEVLKIVPKKFAGFAGFDAAAGTVTLHLEGDKDVTTWPVKPEAEVKVHGWWGRLEQIAKGDRVWVWFSLDRAKKPKAILMLADEISEQDMHGRPCAVVGTDPQAQAVSVAAPGGSPRTLKLSAPLTTASIKPDAKLYLQTAGDQIRLLLTAKELEEHRAKQKEFLSGVWRKQGLPGMVGFLHPLGGEMEVMLDHESGRWGRYLKPGDKITLKPAQDDAAPISVVVKKVQPWREYTRLLLVNNNSLDQADLHIGQRLFALVPEPPAEVQASPLPPDLDRAHGTKEERIEWFLATVYCTCKVGGDQCTGMFYTQASCNINACGMPTNIKNQVGKMIDKGLTDRQILEELLKTRGPELLKPHLLP